MLKVGSKVPSFKLKDQDGIMRDIKDYLGSFVLIYFYPKDDTPGCTREACAIRDDFYSFEKIKAIILGISTDSVKSHKKFAEKYKLPFTLLSDEEKKVVEKFGVWGKKKFMGREYMGTMRTSFLINKEGKIAKIYESVKPEIHAKEVLEDLKNFKR